MPVSALKALRQAKNSGEPLPAVPELAQLTAAGFVPRRGQVLMIAGVSNAGKSAVAQWYIEKTGSTAFYFSADQDPHTTGTRLGAIRSGATTTEVALALHADDESTGYYESLVMDPRVQFCFDSNPSLEDISEEISAYVETWDDFPHIILIDNLVNVDTSGEPLADQFILSELHGLARSTNALVIILAHCSEVTTPDEERPPRKKDLINKQSKYPEMILTVALERDTNLFYLATVKVRGAKSDPNAKYPYVLQADMARCSFTVPNFTNTWGN